MNRNPSGVDEILLIVKQITRGPTMATVHRTMTTADLARVTDKAELIDGQIVLLVPTGRKPGRVGGRIYRSLDDHATASGQDLRLSLEPPEASQ
jgi:hypothetical protein